MALVASLFATALLVCLGAALVLLGSAETTLAWHDVQAQAAGHSARAALALAASELRERSSWSGVTTAGAPDLCAAPGRFVDTSLQPPAPWNGSAIDLHALTLKRQAESDAAAPPGLAPPTWRLFEYGPISRLTPAESRRHPYYLVVWAADGREGIVRLHASAFGPAGATASLEGAFARAPDGSSFRLLSVRGAP